MRIAWVVVCLLALTAVVTAAPALSPPPNPEIVYVEGGNWWKVVVMNRDGSNKTTVFTGARGEYLSDPVLSTDAAWVAFYSYARGLVLVDRVTKAATVLLTNAQCVQSCWNPRFSPSGSRIAFIGEGRTRVLAVPSPTGGAPQVLYYGSPGTLLWDVAWDSDEKRIAVSENVDGSSDRILVITLATQTTETIVSGSFEMILTLDWARNGIDQLVFDTGVATSTDYGIYTVDFSSTGASDPGFVTSGYHPSYSPDNGSIVYRTNRAPYRIVTRDLLAGVTKTLAAGNWPEWKR